MARLHSSRSECWYGKVYKWCALKSDSFEGCGKKAIPVCSHLSKYILPTDNDISPTLGVFSLNRARYSRDVLKLVTSSRMHKKLQALKRSTNSWCPFRIFPCQSAGLTSYLTASWLTMLDRDLGLIASKQSQIG